MQSPQTLRIERASSGDIPVVLNFIRALAVYEKHLENFVADEARLATHLFGENPKAKVLIAYQESEPVGFAVYYFTFSTFAGLPGIYLEDLFVKDEHRGNGIGHALLRRLAHEAKAENCWRIEWSVLTWNQTAIKFYENLGAVPMDEWAVYRLSGESLARLAGDLDSSKP